MLWYWVASQTLDTSISYEGSCPAPREYNMEDGGAQSFHGARPVRTSAAADVRRRDGESNTR